MVWREAALNKLNEGFLSLRSICVSGFASISAGSIIGSVTVADRTHANMCLKKQQHESIPPPALFLGRRRVPGR